MRTLLGPAVALALGAAPLQAAHIPVLPEEDVIEGEGRIAVLASAGEWDPLLELRARLEGEERELRMRALTLGTYYRLHRNVKAGAFLRLQQGARHDDDWVETSPGAWEWQDARDRLEAVLVADVTPRFQLRFLPGESWVLALKARYELDTWNMHQSLKARPSLTWFWIADRSPALNATLAWEGYFPLNFGATLLYEQWTYLELLVHLTPTIKFQASVARRTVIWTDSEDFERSHPAEAYELQYKAWVIGLGLLYMLPL